MRKHPRDTFIYRLAGRDREKSASYYTPQVLARCLVKYALKELLKGKTADEILRLTICEPAMGSAAFINEAVNQLAEAYLERKQAELKKRIPGLRSAIAAASGANADVKFAHGDVLAFGAFKLEVRATPGHTAGCLTYVTHDRARAFTGDALFVRGCGRTDFQGGDARRLYRSIHDKVFSLPEECQLYPGHDYKGRTVTTVWEERTYNPRLGGGRSEDQMVAIMAALRLDRPAKMDEAVPANVRCGVQAGDPSPERMEAPWAPVTRSPTGAPEITAAWLAEHGAGLTVVDVREPEELLGELGQIPGVILAPLGGLAAAAQGWSRAAPLVVVCRSGGRSAEAAMRLERMGFGEVASLAGGMVAWRAREG
jgi:rhodanese-related sulfurtransferase